MKIAISAQGEGLTARLDPRFGRALMFVIYDDETQETTSIDNGQNMNAAQGAGIQAAQTISKSGTGVLITGRCGPKAFKALKAAGIRIYNAPADSSVANALNLYREGSLTEEQNSGMG